MMRTYSWRLRRRFQQLLVVLFPFLYPPFKCGCSWSTHSYYAAYEHALGRDHWVRNRGSGRLLWHMKVGGGR